MLDRLLPFVLFEMPEMGGGDAPASVVDPVEPGAGPDPSPVPGAGGPGDAPEPAPSPTPAPINWDAPEVQAELSRRADLAANQALETRLRAAGLSLGGAPEEPGFELDPFSDEYPQQVVQLLSAVLDQRLGPVDSLMQERTIEGFETTINSGIEKLVPTPEDADAETLAQVSELREGVRFLGEAFATRVDPSSADPVGDALRMGHDWLQKRDKALEERAVTNYRRQLGEIIDTPAEPNGGGAAVRMERRGGSYDDIIERHASRFER